MGRSFASISGCQGEVLVQILDFPIHSIHFHFSLSSKKGEVSQLREPFSPKSPSRMTPGCCLKNFKMAPVVAILDIETKYF